MTSSTCNQKLNKFQWLFTRMQNLSSPTSDLGARLDANLLPRPKTDRENTPPKIGLIEPVVCQIYCNSVSKLLSKRTIFLDQSPYPECISVGITDRRACRESGVSISQCHQSIDSVTGRPCCYDNTVPFPTPWCFVGKSNSLLCLAYGYQSTWQQRLK